MSAPIFQAVGGQSTGTASVSVAWPTHIIDDLGILVIETGGEGTTLTPPAGWTAVPGSPVTDVATTAGSKLQVWYKFATSAAEAAVATGDSGDHQVARIFTFRDVSKTGTFNVSTTGTKTTASTTVTWPSVTTTVSQALVVFIATRPNDNASTTAFATYTQGSLDATLIEAGEAGTTSGHGGGFTLAYATKNSPGSTGAPTVSMGALSVTNAYLVFALRTKSFSLLAGTCVFDETLQPATLTVDRTLTASSDTFAFNGNDVTLTKTTPAKILTADVATFTEDLKPANLNVSRTLFCAVATFTEDLKPANLNVSRTLFCAVATYTVEGTETNFNRGVSLTADSQPYTFIGRDATLFPSRYLSLARTTFTITGPPASLIAIADTHTVTIDPPAGWALHLVTDVSQAGISACIYYNLSPAVAVGDQILYRTTTETNSNAVSVSSTGIVSTVPSGSDTLKFRHWRPSTWSAELTFTVSITARTLTADTQTYALDGKVTALPVKKIRYVNTTSTSGGTGRTNATTGADRAYATLRSALETEQADLVAQNVKLEIYCAGGADSSTSSQQNWPSMVTGPNNDIKIYAAPGNEAEESFNSNKYHIARFTGGQEAINLGTTDNLYISYYNLQIKSTLTTHVAFRIGATTSGTTTGKVVVSGCYIEGGTTAYGTSFNSRNQPHVVVNSILVTTGGVASNTIASVFYNNTVISYSTGAAATPQPGSTIPYYMRNNIFQNYGGGVALSGTLPTNTSSNITNDATSPEVGLRNITLIFRDKVGKNYRLISEDSAGIGSGTNLSADPIYPITVDLLGSTRTTWDIGAVKYVPLISLSSRIYLLNTSETSLTTSRTLSCDPATYAEDLQPANLTLQRKISSNVGYFRLLTVARQTNFSDNFNRADESLDASANWQRADIEVGSLSIINNRVSGGANIGNVYSGALADDQWAEFTFSGIAPSGTSKGAAVLLRATGGTSSFTGYVVSLERSNTEPGTDLVRIRYCLNVATFTNAFSLGTLLASYRVPDFANNTSGAVVLRAEVVGSIITAYINGSPCLFVSDSQSTSGKVGIWTDSANIDDFNSGSFTDTLFLKANRTLSCDPATYTLELKDATLTKVSAKVLTADSQTYNEDLQPANLKAARTLLATTQTYNEDLQPANLTAAKRLVADSQIYTFTGKDASFSSAEVFGTISRQYTLSGNNVLFLRSVISTSVAYTFTGRDANLFRGERLTAESRAYNLTGRDAALNHAARVTADTSTFTLIGRDASLLRGERLTADTSTYTFTGRDANLLRAERVTADVSSFALIGRDANLLRGERVTAESRAYNLTGRDAALNHAARLTADTRFYSLTRNDATLNHAARLTAESSSYTLIRNDANLSVTRKLVADSSSYALTGNNVLFAITGSLNVTTATFTLTGNSVNFVRSRILVAATQPYNFVPNDAILKTSKKVIADKATYTLTGRAANLAAGEISTSDSQSFILTGNSVRFNRSVKSIVSSYTLTASDTSLKVGRKISLTVSSYITSGIATNLLANKKILAVRVFFDTNGYVEPGYTDPNYVSIDAGIISSRLIIGQTITYNLNGNIVIIVRGGFIKVWTGSAWVSKPLKVWDGTAWVSKPLKVWTGSTWRTY